MPSLCLICPIPKPHTVVMNNWEIKTKMDDTIITSLPEEFRSSNSVEVERATIKRERMLEILRNFVVRIQLRSSAQQAILADRCSRGEVTVTWDSEGERILLVSRQDDEHNILSVIAQAGKGPKGALGGANSVRQPHESGTGNGAAHPGYRAILPKEFFDSENLEGAEAWLADQDQTVGVGNVGDHELDDNARIKSSAGWLLRLVRALQSAPLDDPSHHTMSGDGPTERVGAGDDQSVVNSKPVTPKRITRATLVELLDAIYTHHGWRRAPGESMSARAAEIYDLAADMRGGLYVATPKANPTASEQLGWQTLGGAPNLTNPLTPYGLLIRALRIVAGATLMEMSEGIGYTPSHLSSVEFGREGISNGLIRSTYDFFVSKGVAVPRDVLDRAAHCSTRAA